MKGYIMVSPTGDNYEGLRVRAVDEFGEQIDGLVESIVPTEPGTAKALEVITQGMRDLGYTDIRLPREGDEINSLVHPDDDTEYIMQSESSTATQSITGSQTTPQKNGTNKKSTSPSAVNALDTNHKNSRNGTG